MRALITGVPSLAIVLIGLLTVGACSPEPSPSRTLRATPTPVPGPTLLPTATRTGTGSGDCGGIPDALCEDVWTAAFDFGLAPQLAPRVVRWEVRPTVVRSCGGYLAPKFDVTFQLDSGPDVTVTVGQYPEGRLAACTY